jgi:hypothetical protein
MEEPRAKALVERGCFGGLKAAASTGFLMPFKPTEGLNGHPAYLED